MARFFSVASLLFSSYIALAAAESIPRMRANDIVVRLEGGALQSCSAGQCVSYDIQFH